MTVTVNPATIPLTADSLLSLPRPEGGRHYELSDGELIVVGNAGSLHELIKAKLLEIFIAYRLRVAEGKVFSETQFTLRSDRVRIPDVCLGVPGEADTHPTREPGDCDRS